MVQTSQILQGHYQLQQKLGHNAGRQTWLASDIATSPAEPVVVKLLAFSPQMQWDDFKLFEREAQVLKQLNHPQIPRYRDYFSLEPEASDRLRWFALVQDYIPGQSLQQLLQQGKRFTEAQVRKIASDVLEILTELHSLNPPVLHRDIKPSNLILGKDHRVYLVDFGAVQNSTAAEGVTFTVVGTTGYAPLEQFWGKAVPASDLYALGATLIHLLTGTTPADLPQKNMRIQFSDRVSTNPTLVRWIEAITEPDLEQRCSTAAEALEALQTGRSLHTPLLPISQPPSSRVQLKKSPDSLSIRLPRHKLSFQNVITLVLKVVLTVGSLPFLLVIAILLLLGLAINLAMISFGSSPLLIALPIFLLSGFLWFATTQEFNNLQDELNQNFVDYFRQKIIYLSNDKLVVKNQQFTYKQIKQFGRILSVEATLFENVAIQTKLNRYTFGQELTELERQWLVQEIKDWLAEEET
ncbi:MAG: serine/threonine protein kinase [Kastovskya adunca ATA6-11-RM4]|jgi:serine/threonine protein kinase|nr:serine/threonine protein kinase [Kastovskya adunca ATA6-11-RM4]